MTKKEFLDYVNSFNKESGDFSDDELYDIGVKYKELPLSEKNWSELVQLLGVTGEDGALKTGEAFRCWIKARQTADGTIPKNVKLISGQTIENMSFKEFEEKTEEIKRELYKQQIKTRDTMNSYRRVMRNEARLDDFKDLMRENVVDITKLSEVKYDGNLDVNAEAVLMLSDLHIGVQIDNYYNKYNVTIARKRIKKLVSDVVRYCKHGEVKRLYVLGLGDFCHGLIHTSARLEEEIDVVKQIMLASEILADTLNELKAAAPEIVFASCTDNHSRMMPSLNESIEAENYGKLIVFYLKTRLENSGIIFKEDNLDQEIGLIEFENGKTGIFAHGHHDNINSIFQNMTAFTGRVIDYAFIGHYHCEKMKTFNNFKVFVNGSVVGLDQYAFSKRLFGKPSQTLIIFDGDNLINHSINLDIQ